MSFLSMFSAACVLFLTPLPAAAQEDDLVVERHVAILSAYRSFDAALADAKKISKASKVPFSMQDRIYDKERGLIYPDNFDDEAFRGSYVARRYDTAVVKGSDEATSYLSVERSDAYQNFKPGFYIVLAGIQDSREKALKQAEKFKTWAPTAYVKKTKIYIGCLH